MWAWGANQAGQLGDGTTANSPVPVKVAGLSQVTGISAGEDASVATRTNVVGPVQVTGLTSATQVSAGRAFSLAVHTVPWLTGQSS